MTGKGPYHWLLALALVLPLLGTVRAADKPVEEEEAEAKEAAEEDKQAANMDLEVDSPLKHFAVRGKLFIDPSAKGPVVGHISGKEGSYLLKVEKRALLDELIKVNNKEVGLLGCLRNKGKYLLVTELAKGVQPTLNLSDPRGL